MHGLADYEANVQIQAANYCQDMLGRVRCDNMAVLRIAVYALALIYHIAGAKRSNLSTSKYQNQLVAGLHKWPTCPLWKYHKYHNSSCECGSGIDNIIVGCKDNQSIFLLSCHCMSYSDNGDGVVMGACPFLCMNYFYIDIDADTNLSTLCDRHIRQNRQGQMCGQCKDNHSPSPYSYELKCAHCSHYKYNWLKYLVVAYAPLTAFFFTAIIFRLNALSASMNGIIFFSQMVSSPAVMSMVSTYVYFSNTYPTALDINLTCVADIVATVFGIWNLDFFRLLYKPFCLHPKLSMIQIMCLDYLIAVYPLLLIVLTFILLRLYERFQIVRIFFKPLVWLFAHVHHQWNASTSLIEAFATFILLSYVKVINTSFDILMPTQLYSVSGQVVGLYVYYNGSLEYFGRDHLPYAVIAIFMFITFNLVPFLLLCLYPCRCFQSCLNCCRLNSQVLRTFMDAFQGCYKFEPYDCRYWAAFYLFLRIAILAIFAFTQGTIFFAVVCGTLFILAVVMTTIVRPYREPVYNIIDLVFFLLLIQSYFSTAGVALLAPGQSFLFVATMFGISIIIPLAYIILLAVYKILPNSCIVYTKYLALHLLRLRQSSLRRRNT
jgi:hypothetical protein